MPNPLPVSLVVTILVVALPALLAFCTTMVAVQNGAPVLFPGWVRLGTTVGGGMENLGQGVMTMGIILMIVALLLVVPVGVAAIGVWLLEPLGAAVAAFGAIVAGSALLGAETVGIFAVLGRALEKTEPSETAYAS